MRLTPKKNNCFGGGQPQAAPTARFAVESIGLGIIQMPNRGIVSYGIKLTDFEWAPVRLFLPNKPRGIPRVDDRRVINGIFWVYAQVPPAATCPRLIVLARRMTTASFVGDGLAYRAGSWMR
jgi:hypothetical protein